MKTWLSFSGAIILGAAMAAPVMADPRPAHCNGARQDACAAPVQGQPQDHRAQNRPERRDQQNGPAAQPHRAQNHAPRPGDSARRGQPFQRAENSRFPPPGPGQDYRVMRDNLVLVDSQTLKIVRVLGALSDLVR